MVSSGELQGYPVKMISNGRPGPPQVPPGVAAQIVRRNLCGFEGKVSRSSGRVYLIREVKDPRKNPYSPFDESYWADRAVLRYHVDQSSTPIKVRNRKLSQLWDRMLKRDSQ